MRNSGRVCGSADACERRSEVRNSGRICGSADACERKQRGAHSQQFLWWTYISLLTGRLSPPFGSETQ